MTVPEDRPVKSDHLPIDTIIEVVTRKAMPTATYNYRVLTGMNSTSPEAQASRHNMQG